MTSTPGVPSRVPPRADLGERPEWPAVVRCRGARATHTRDPRTGRRRGHRGCPVPVRRTGLSNALCPTPVRRTCPASCASPASGPELIIVAAGAAASASAPWLRWPGVMVMVTWLVTVISTTVVVSYVARSEDSSHAAQAAQRPTTRTR